MAYSGFNLPDGCRPEDIPGNYIEPESYWPEREDYTQDDESEEG